MITIHIKTVYNEYTIPEHKEEYHEGVKEFFRATLERLISRDGIQWVNLLDVFTEYYPEKSKFKIVEITHRYRDRVNRIVRDNEGFRDKYII